MAQKKRRSRQKHLEAQRQKRARIWMSVIITVIMVFSTIAIVVVQFAGPSTTADGASLGSCRIEENLVYCPTDMGEVYFYTLPGSYPLPAQTTEVLEGASQVIVAFDPTDEENLPYIEQVRWDFANYLDATPAASVLQPSDQYNFPVGGCENAAPQSPVIMLVNGTDGVAVNGSCLVVSAQRESFLLIRDAIIYSHWGLQ